ncbi:MAG: OmpA family protein [Myxococcota bacterium]
MTQVFPGMALFATLAIVGTAEAAPAAESSASAEGRIDASEASGSTSGSAERRDREDKWIYRWAPERNMAELGVFGGVWFPSRHLELFEPTEGFAADGHQLLRLVTPEVGLRAGYYPLRWVGVEVEGGAMPTRTLDSNGRATAWNVRGHIVGQLGLWSVTPFILAGTGMLGVASAGPPEGIGSEQDVAIHFGGGVKVYFNRWVQMRLDVRNVVSNRLGVGDGLTSSPEVLLGLSVTLGRKRHRESVSERPQGRPGDRDGDGVRDRDDYCPDTPGAAPRGCPQVCVDDNDGDGLANPVDKCPEQPESRNGFEDSDGCPDEVPPELADLSGVMNGINFDVDKAKIKADSRPTLDRAVEVMKKYRQLRVRITGHTDAIGGYRHNVDLSQRRAKSVKRYMVSKGIRERRIETAGVGPDEPIDSNETKDGRANNRRIEFTILERDEQATVTAGGD